MISVNTEMTEYIKGWVFYDGECLFCRRWAERGHDVLLRHGFHLAPLQSLWVRLRLGLKEGEPLTEMKLLMADGTVFGGVDALVEIARSIWWAWPVYPFAVVPGVRSTLRVIYRNIARNRRCLAVGNNDGTAQRQNAHHRTSSFYEMP